MRNILVGTRNSRRDENFSCTGGKIISYKREKSRTNENIYRSNEKISHPNEKKSRINENILRTNEKNSRTNENKFRTNGIIFRSNEKNILVQTRKTFEREFSPRNEILSGVVFRDIHPFMISCALLLSFEMMPLLMPSSVKL